MTITIVFLRGQLGWFLFSPCFLWTQRTVQYLSHKTNSFTIELSVETFNKYLIMWVARIKEKSAPYYYGFINIGRIISSLGNY